MSKIRSFNKRKGQLGDASEKQFVAWANRNQINYYPTGFNRPELKHFAKLPPDLRHMPDFLVEEVKPMMHYFMECKGVGKDQIIKLKYEDICSLQCIESFFELPVHFFVFDSSTMKISYNLNLVLLETFIEDLEKDWFEDYGNRKLYFKVPVERLAWEQLITPT